MNEFKNPTTVNLDIPKPKAERISKLAIYFIVGLLISFFVIVMFELPERPNSKQADVSEQRDTKASTEDQSWYLSKPNSLNTNNTKVANSNSNSGVLSDELIASDASSKAQSELEKIKQEDYLKAINSSFAPSGMESDQTESQTKNENNALSENNSASLDPSQRKLPLSNEQIAKLSNDFGVSDQNLQAEKHQFVEAVARKTDKDYLNETLKNPVSPYEVQAGNIIPAMMGGGIDSDLPGQVTATVRQNVYDSVTGRYLLIPQGSKLIIIYDSNIAFGQERVLPAVKRVIFPNGQSMDLEGMPASDVSGYAGFNDQVDNHYGKIYGAAIIMGGIAAAFQVSQPTQGSALVNPSNTQAAAGAMGQQLAQVTTTTVSKNLNIQPTLKIRPGYPFNVNITADMIFPHPYIG